MLKYIGVGRNHLGGCPRVETAPRWPSVSSSFLLCHCFHGLSILSSTVEALDSKGGGFFFLQQLLAEMKSYVKQVRSSSDSIIHLSLFIWRSLWRVNGRTWLNFTGLYTDWWFSVFFFGDLDLWLSLGKDFPKPSSALFSGCAGAIGLRPTGSKLPNVHIVWRCFKKERNEKQSVLHSFIKQCLVSTRSCPHIKDAITWHHGMSEDGWWKATPNHVASRMQSVSVELFFLLRLFPGIFSVLALVLKRRLQMKKMQKKCKKKWHEKFSCLKGRWLLTWI